MVKPRKLLYMALGGILALSLAFGAFATFAQTDDEGSDDAVPSEGSESTPDVPSGDRAGGPRGFDRSGQRPDDSKELLAEELGITVEALQEARDAVRTALIEQAVADGLLTQEQADELLSGERSGRGGFGLRHHDDLDIDVEALLAEELGITVEELQAARDAVKEAQLEQLVADGVITEEQMALMLARQAVQDYIDVDAINDSVQSAYETAVDQALSDGVITQEQADQMLENIPTFNGFGGRGGHHFRGGPRGHHGGFGQQSFDNNLSPLEGSDA